MTAPWRRRTAGFLPRLFMIAAASGATAAQADVLPPGIRACTAQTDALARLECYDREVARLTAVTPPAPVTGPAVPAAATAAPPVPSPAAPATVPAAPTPAASAAAALPTSPPAAAAASGSRHFTAQVTKVDYYGDEVVVHLDNGQTWEQTQVPDRDLNLRAGDTVTLDRQLGSWWLSVRAATMKVRLRH